MRAVYLKVMTLGLLAVATTACVYNPPRVSASYTVSSGGYFEPWGYYYYPDVQVYFHISTGYYFYRTGTRWIRTRVLPTFIHLDAHRVKLHIENDQPYLYHHQHIERYRPRPQYRWTPSGDRREREQNLRGYHEQQKFKSERRTAPREIRPGREAPQYYQPQRRTAPPVYNRSAPASQGRQIQQYQTPYPYGEQKSQQRRETPSSRPQDRNQRYRIEQEQQYRYEKQKQTPATKRRNESPRYDTYPVPPANSRGKEKSQKSYQRSNKVQQQQEEQDQKDKRSKRRNKDDEDQNYYRR